MVGWDGLDGTGMDRGKMEKTGTWIKPGQPSKMLRGRPPAACVRERRKKQMPATSLDILGEPDERGRSISGAGCEAAPLDGLAFGRLKTNDSHLHPP